MNAIERIEFIRKEGAIKGRSGRRLGSASLSTDKNLQAIKSILLQESPERTLEIGAALGASTMIISEYLKNAFEGSRLNHYAIDPFQSTAWDSVAIENLESIGTGQNVKIIEEFSHTALPKLLDERQGFDFIYIDGSHLFEDVFIDIFYSLRLLRSSGIVLLDDCSDPHVYKVVNFARRNLKHCCEEIDLSHYRGSNSISDRLKYYIARKLGKVQMVGFRRVGEANRPWDSTFVSF